MAPPNSDARLLNVDAHLNNGGMAPLGPSHETMVVQLTAPKKDAKDNKVSLDLVAVLDTSGSMGDEGKLNSMKKAMSYVIDKMGDKNRLSIVTFSTKAVETEQAELRHRTHVDQDKSKKFINGLKEDGWTMMSDGLTLGLGIIDRRPKEVIEKKAAAIFLMSDGHENNGSNAAAVVIPAGVTVHTFGFGAGHDNKLLKKIAKKSHGGTYHPILDTSEASLKEAFSQPLAGHKGIVIKDLELTLTQDPTITMMEAELGAYRPKPIGPGSVTFTVGELFSEENRRLTVDFDLSATDKEGEQSVLTLKWTYRHMPEAKKVERRRDIEIKRTAAAAPRPPSNAKPRTAAEMFSAAVDPYMKKQVRTEVVRRAHFRTLKDVKTLAKNKQLDDAQDKLLDAMNDLDKILRAPVELSRDTIKFLFTELEELRDLMDTEEMCDKQALAYARAAILSHGRQRFAARGDVNDVRLFTTPRMDKYLQAIKDNED